MPSNRFRWLLVDAFSEICKYRLIFCVYAGFCGFVDWKTFSVCNNWVAYRNIAVIVFRRYKLKFNFLFSAEEYDETRVQSVYRYADPYDVCLCGFRTGQRPKVSEGRQKYGTNSRRPDRALYRLWRRPVEKRWVHV